MILDDAERDGEAWVLERWQQELGLSVQRRTGALALATVGAPPAREGAPTGTSRNYHAPAKRKLHNGEEPHV